MLEALERYYREQGILSTAFTCTLKDDCKGDCKTFTGPKSAFVSPGYERRDLPRLLFLSLDSGGGSRNAGDRLPEAVRREEMEFSVVSLRGKEKSWHWYRTHELAWYILRRFDADLSLENVKGYFAHTNSAKCSMNKTGNDLADERLFLNCRPYLSGELSILCPDILVTQGQYGQSAIKEIYGSGESVQGDAYASRIEMDSRPVFWLHTSHPGRFGDFNRQRSGGRGWEKYADMVHEFGSACGWPKTTPLSE